MNLWPFNRREIRESPYTDALLAQILAQANSGTVSDSATAAVETVAGIVQRAFVSAVVSAPEPFSAALSPACLGSIGRALVRRGECVMGIAVHGNAVRLNPASDWDIRGDYDESSWTYRLTLSGPTHLNTQSAVTSDGVVHPRYSYDHERPWRGIGPLQSAALAGKLSAETVNALADESGSMMGYVLPTPKDGGDTTIASLKADLRTSKGKTHLVQSMDNWGMDPAGRRASGDWMRQRLGPEPPASMVDLQETATREVLMACGVSPSLFGGATASASREGFRQLLHGTIAPLGRILEQELQAKLDPSITLSFESLFAADLQGRARAFQSMIGGGMDIERAAALSGLMIDE